MIQIQIQMLNFFVIYFASFPLHSTELISRGLWAYDDTKKSLSMFFKLESCLNLTTLVRITCPALKFKTTSLPILKFQYFSMPFIVEKNVNQIFFIYAGKTLDFWSASESSEKTKRLFNAILCFSCLFFSEICIFFQKKIIFFLQIFLRVGLFLSLSF